jgi:hypothetical protein
VKKLLLLGIALLVGLSLMVFPLGLAASSSASTTGGSAAGIAGLQPVLGQAYTLAATKVHNLVPACRGMRWEILAGVAEVETTQAAGHQIDPEGEITPPSTDHCSTAPEPAATPSQSSTPPRPSCSSTPAATTPAR